jgi:hypothetical protein
MTLSYIPSDTNDEGVLKATASGTLPNGKAVIVNADGTVSVVVSSSASIGSEATFSATAIQKPSATFDTTNNKIVVTYINSSNYIAVVVGTVSGTSISFGTPVIAESSSSEEPTVVFDTSNNKVVLTYRQSNNGKSVVGTVSGTSISFGAKTTFKSGGVEYTNSVFDSNSNKIVAIWSDDNNSKAGTAIVGTVSGTSISFGSSTVFKASGIFATSPAFDSTNNKIVIVYNPSNVLEAVVGTVSGTSISFGAPVSSGLGGVLPLLAMGDSTGQGVIGYRLNVSPTDGRAVSVTVSGTSVSFGTDAQFSPAVTAIQNVVFDSSRNTFFIVYGVNIFPVTLSGTDVSFGSSSAFSAENINQVGAALDNNDKLVLAYRNLTDSQAGQSLVFTPASTTLTSENYIGISTGGTYASGSTATVKIIGNTSNEQTSLTAGQAYYVQTDGTIGTTAASPSVFAGTAISATKLIVKT